MAGRLSSPRLVAEAAIDAHLLRLVALHAAAHADVTLFEELFALHDFAVTVRARIPGLEMRTVAETDIRRNLVDPYPGHRPVLRGEIRQLPDRRTVPFHRGVALHAGRSRRDRHA